MQNVRETADIPRSRIGSAVRDDSRRDVSVSTRAAFVRTRVLHTLAILLGAAVLLWPSVYNGRPPVFADTAYYFSLGEYASELLGWVDPREARVEAGDPTRLTPRTAQAPPSIAFTIMGARAPSYAMPLYWTQRIGGLWLTAGLQALAASWVLYLLAKGAAPERPLGLFAVLAGVAAALTPLPFFTGFAMPDVFGGIAAAAGVALLVWRDRYGKIEKGALAALYLFALSLHGSHPLTAVGLAVVGAALLWSLGAGLEVAARRAVALVVLAAAAVGVNAAGFALIARAGGEPLGRPPFLTARLLADGPGRVVLRADCARDPAAWVICADAHKRLDNSELILWRDTQPRGVFGASGFERRLAISAQDGAFARSVVLREPRGVALAALNNWRRQLEKTFVDDPLTNPGFWMQNHFWKRTNLKAITPDPQPCLTRAGCPVSTPKRAFKSLHLWVAAVAAAWLIVRLSAATSALVRRGTRPDWAADPWVRVVSAGLLLGAAVLINAAVCGMISGPFPRYQARVIWLLPMAIAMLEAAALPRWRRRLRSSRRRVPPLDLERPARAGA